MKSPFLRTLGEGLEGGEDRLIFPGKHGRLPAK